MSTNTIRLLSWAEIAGECIGANESEGYDTAMLYHDMYAARLAAETESRWLHTWNLISLSSKRESAMDFRVKDDTHTQETYRKMVRANCKVNI